MFLELIATFAAGFAGAGVALLLTKLTGGRLPRGLIPIFAGGAMIAVTIANEYSWYPRTQAALPDGFTVAEHHEGTMPYRPWTYLVPLTERFVAVDIETLRRHPDRPDEVIADLYLYARWAPANRVQVLFDCAGGRSMPLLPETRFNADGSVADPKWQAGDSDAAVRDAACTGQGVV